MQYYNIVKYFLVGILLFLPFQHNVVKIIRLHNIAVSVFLDRLEEFIIIIFSLLAGWEILKKRKILNPFCLVIFLPILFLIASGIVSGIVNGNSLLVTLHGTFNYVKYFFVIFIYSVFFKEFSELRKMFRILLVVAVFLGTVAFIQEVWALGNRYVLHKDINTEIFYLNVDSFINPRDKGDYYIFWRLGILRVPSLMISPNFLGLYMLLILAIYTQIAQRISPMVFIPLFSGIFGSVSRVVYTSFLLLGCIQILRGRKWWVFPLLPIVIVLLYLSPLPDYIRSKSTPEEALNTSFESVETEQPKWAWDAFRAYARKKGIEIWKDHILLGAGPGTYGSGISLKYKSPIYEEYNFDPMRKLYLDKIKTSDQFWPQVLAELGLIGAASMVSFFVLLALTLYKLGNSAFSVEMRGLYQGLIIYLVIVVLYSFGYSLNIPPIVFTFFAITGIGLGLKRPR